MFHHISLGVKNYEEAVKFYSETLSALYASEVKPVESVYPEFIQDNKVLFPGVRFTNFIHVKDGSCLSLIDLTYGIRDPVYSHDYGSTKASHISFSATTEEQVQAWYSKALELGATDNGAPGPRPHYGPDYYAAFVIDPHGYRLEVCIRDYVKGNNL